MMATHRCLESRTQRKRSQHLWTGEVGFLYNERMEELQAILKGVLSDYPEVKLCIVFGSAASGRASERSDLDIAVAAAQALTPDMCLQLTEACQAATNRPTDLVDLMAVSGPILKQVLSKGRVVQNHDKNLYARLISRMLFDQADMMPYYDRILRERRKRFLHG